MEFLSWRRSKIVSESEEKGGRLGRSLKFVLSTDGNPSAGRPHDVPFVFPSASDVGALRPNAIRHLAPAPFAPDAETTKCAHVDFDESDLPWRYTPKRSVQGDKKLPPWMVLLVGTTEEIGAEHGVVTKVTDDVLNAHPLARSHLWAHVQKDNEVSIGRLLSPRPLAPLQNHVAVIVPAFTGAGEKMWEPGLRRFESLPALYAWQFRAGEEGDFETLAAALRLRSASGLGIAKLNYRRETSGISERLTVRGAITSIGGAPDEHDAVERARDDLALIRAQLRDPVDPPTEARTLIQMPDHGSLWEEETSKIRWTRSMNDDPRHRGVAGLGLNAGIVAQEALMDAAVKQAGALQDAAQRVNNLATGLEAARRLWRRRLPKRPALQLRLFGPAMGRMIAADGGTVLDRATSEMSTLDPAVFSSAAQRRLRNRTAAARGMKGCVDRAAFLDAANKQRPTPEKTPDGLPHVDGVAESLGEPPLEKAMRIPDIDPRRLEDVLRKFENVPIEPDSVVAFLDAVRDGFGLECDGNAIFGDFLSGGGGRRFVFERELMLTAISRCISASLPRAELPTDNAIPFPPRHEDRSPVNIDGLAGAVGGAVDPTVPRPPAVVRVTSTIKGIDVSDLAPPEARIGLDYPTWTLVNRHSPEWLLPGAKSIPMNSIVALQTNPAFVDAFMVGINTQFLSEMRWRNLPAPRVSTPLRMFWGYANHANDRREPDIRSIADWPGLPAADGAADDVGDLSHQNANPAAATGRQNLVIAFRTPLFRRYPNTLVYLVRPRPSDNVDAVLKGKPAFDAAVAPGQQRYLLPVFRGRMEPDLVFFAFDAPPRDLAGCWLVLDEPPMELRFRSDKTIDAPSSADYADATIDNPTRVAIDGVQLAAEV